MLDVQDFITSRGGDPEKIRQSQIKRGAPVEIVDEVIALWEEHRKTNYAGTQIGSEINAVQKEIGMKKKNKESADDLLEKKKQLDQQKADKLEQAATMLKDLNVKVKSVGNYVHSAVPVSNTEDDNVVLREWKPEKSAFDEFEKPEQILSHHQVLTRIGGYDPDRGVKIAGHRGYCLTGYGVFLNQALINYGLQFLYKKGYQPNQPPFFMNRAQMAKTAQLSEFDEELYKVIEDQDEKTEPKYLIATSEQPLSSIHSEEWLQPAELPIKYAGYSTCFRKEAGKHGHDAWGIFRIHQFEKVEQFVICGPDDSWKHYEEMMATSEEFYKSLGVPYHVIAIVSGALNNAASAKYDLEAWFPFQKEFKELVSCSNCTDYQTRELEIRHGTKKAKEGPEGTRKAYVHALNATLTATERTLCCLLENFQTKEGLFVPEVLRKWIPGEPSIIPYVNPAPVEVPIRKK